MNRSNEVTLSNTWLIEVVVPCISIVVFCTVTEPNTNRLLTNLSPGLRESLMFVNLKLKYSDVSTDS